MRYRQSHGFTLKELFVLFGILALLAVWLWPVFFGAGDKPKSAACQSNLKQLSLAIFMYAQDYDGTLPPAVAPSGIGWSRLANQYVRNDELFRCPEDVERFRIARPLDLDHPNGFSYIANGEVLRSAKAKAYSTAAIKNPAWTVLLTERKHDAPVGWSFTARTFSVAVDPRHNSGAHWSFVDGHVKWIRLQEFTESETDYTVVPALKEAGAKDVTTGNAGR